MKTQYCVFLHFVSTSPFTMSLKMNLRAFPMPISFEFTMDEERAREDVEQGEAHNLINIFMLIGDSRRRRQEVNTLTHAHSCKRPLQLIC